MRVTRASLCFNCRAANKPSLFNSRSAAYWSSCCSKSDFAFATSVSSCNRCVLKSALRFFNAASADRHRSSADVTASRRSGLLNSRITESGFTIEPACSTIRSTRPDVVAVIHRMSSGTNVPDPLTSRTSGPRMTLPVQAALASTVGAAGFRFITQAEIPMRTSTPITARMVCRCFFRFRIAGSRFTSIAMPVSYARVGASLAILP